MWQYGRRLCLRIDSVPTKTNESSDDVLDSVKSLFKEAKVDIPESVIDRAHRIGSRYLDASSNNCYKSIIVCFTTFRHRTMFYRAKNKLKRGVRIKLDLTKSKYGLLKRAKDHVKEVTSIKFCYADINCHLKVKFNAENQKDIFFSSFDNLLDICRHEDRALFVNLSVSVFVLFCFLSLGLWQNFFNKGIKYRLIFKSNYQNLWRIT